MDKIIKVGFCVSYDWQYLKKSLPRVYSSADIICLSLDHGRRAWSGKKYDFDEEEFHNWLSSADPHGKIRLYEDNFSLPDLTSMENDSRQRNMMAKFLGEGGWHIQVDSDEYFVDFEGFCQYLRKLLPYPTGREKPFNVHVFLYDLFKKVEGGYLYIDFKNNRPYSAPFATTKPDYWRARQNGHFNKPSPFFVVHETWARGEEQLLFKLENWGHSAEELQSADVRQSYINLWRAIDRYNFRYLHNFHFALPNAWESLKFGEGETIEDFIRDFKPNLAINKLELAAKKMRVYGKVKSIIDKWSKNK